MKTLRSLFAFRLWLPALLSVLLTAGCSTFRATQMDAFIDEDGNVLQARYGELTKPYKYQIVSPVNGASLTCEDKRMVQVRLPDPNGSWIDCYVCQNDSPKGKMYATRDGKWKYWTIGIASRLYLQNETKDDYLLVFEGKFFTAGSGPKGQTL